MPQARTQSVSNSPAPTPPAPAALHGGRGRSGGGSRPGSRRPSGGVRRVSGVQCTAAVLTRAAKAWCIKLHMRFSAFQLKACPGVLCRYLGALSRGKHWRHLSALGRRCGRKAHMDRAPVCTCRRERGIRPAAHGAGGCAAVEVLRQVPLQRSTICPHTYSAHVREWIRISEKGVVQPPRPSVAVVSVDAAWANVGF